MSASLFIGAATVAAGMYWLSRRQPAQESDSSPAAGNTTGMTWEDYSAYDDRRHMGQWLGYKHSTAPTSTTPAEAVGRQRVRSTSTGGRRDLDVGHFEDPTVVDKGTWTN